MSYDANGNITKYKRNKDAGITQDSLNYKYNAGTNQLQYITDNVASNVSTTDIDNQSPNNYIYDKSGNMVADNSQSMSVSWSPYGKILQNNKAGGANLTFGYNAMQQRVLKRVVLAGDTTRTYYIRDAQGNTMGVYTRHNDSVTWREQSIFGSSRLGLYKADTLVNKGLTVISKLYEGKRNYELTNHLGNVMVVINDRKADTTIGVNKGYNAVVISAVDYYPFGMAIDSRTYTSALYRYGFNGKETDKETGEQDYGMRIYDPRIAKFLSIDPINGKYPELTPYQFASNSPILGVDLDGLEFATPAKYDSRGFLTTPAIDNLISPLEHPLFIPTPQYQSSQAFFDVPYEEKMRNIRAKQAAETFKVIVADPQKLSEGDLLEWASILPVGKLARWVKVGERVFHSAQAAKKFASIEAKIIDQTVIKAIYESGKFNLGVNKLRTALKESGNLLKGKWQAHHLIPGELLEKNEFIQQGVKEGFDFNGLSNGLALDVTRHSGSHSKYTAAVENLISGLKKNFPNSSAKEILERASGVIKETIQKTNGKINEITKF